MLDTIAKELSSLQLRKLKTFGSKINKLGVNFAVCSADGELVLLCDGGKFSSGRERLTEAGLRALNWDGQESRIGTETHVCRSGQPNQVLAAVLKSASATGRAGETVGVALLDTGYSADRRPVEIPDARCENQESRIENRDAIFSEMLAILAENFQDVARAEKQIEMVSTELAQVYEELVLLHKLGTNMKVTEPDVKYLQMACDSLTEIVSVEGIAVLLEKTIENERQLTLVAGSGLIDMNEQLAAILKERLAEEISSGREALLDSEVDLPFKYDWPEGTKNIIAVPLYGKDKTGPPFAERVREGSSIIGLMVAINRVDKPDFDSTDVKLFNSVANDCAVFIENGRLFEDLKELFIGSLRALTSSIDAKDEYTRGHSERVAFISRWIAERLIAEGILEEEQVHKIYLAGLLHDIGKVGIDEAVLRKKGKLTGQELSRIKTHPSIGAGILGGIKQMRDIVPGVLYHHERTDGKGYPNGLAAEQIPLTGKIVGLADSFDAMTSKRTYRNAMTVEQALAEIEKELGTQFDEKVGRIFINSDVYHLWDIMRGGFGEVYENGNFSEYGTIAVGTLLR